MNPTREDILAEIDELLENYPPMEANDITAKDLMEEKGKSHSASIELMRRMVKNHPDKYMMTKVRSNNSGWQWALRRK